MKSMLIMAGMLVASGALAANEPSVPDFKIEQSNLSLILTPPPGHHFNPKAPHRILITGEARPLTTEEHRIWTTIPADAGAAPLEATAYVCDDANTYCLKKTEKLVLAAVTPGHATSAAKAAAPEAAAAPGADSGVEKETGFILNDAPRALALAAKTGRPLLIDFFGIWCPPCNHLDEMVFKSSRFKSKTAKTFVKLKLDSDQEFSAALKARYKIQGLPTVIFATPSGEEITRAVGYRPLEELLATAATVLASPSVGYDSLLEKARKGDAAAREQAARIALDREEAKEALELLTPLQTELERAGAGPRAELWSRARLGAAVARQDVPAAREVLVAWLERSHATVQALENYQQLADLEDQAGHADASRAALEAATALITELTRAPARLRNSGYTLADLRETEGDLYVKLGKKEKARAAHLECAKAYSAEARLEKSAFARGPSLEKAYCLAEAGEISASEAIYREGIRRFPEEFTFHKQLADLLLTHRNKPEEALTEADEALRHAYGNQRLKATWTKVKVLEAQGKNQAGIEAIDQILGLPVKVTPTASTLQLRSRLEKKRTELQKKLGAS